MTRNQIAIIDFWNSYNGLELTYSIAGKETSVEFSREETMNYLDSAGVIVIKDGMVMYYDELISYEDWRDMELLEEDDLRDVAMIYEAGLQAKATCERIMKAA